MTQPTKLVTQEEIEQRIAEASEEQELTRPRRWHQWRNIGWDNPRSGRVRRELVKVRLNESVEE